MGPLRLRPAQFGSTSPTARLSSVPVRFHQLSPRPTASSKEVDSPLMRNIGLPVEVETSSVLILFRSTSPTADSRRPQGAGPTERQYKTTQRSQLEQSRTTEVQMKSLVGIRRKTLDSRTTSPLLKRPPGWQAALEVTGELEAVLVVD